MEHKFIWWRTGYGFITGCLGSFIGIIGGTILLVNFGTSISGVSLVVVVLLISIGPSFWIDRVMSEQGSNG